MTLRYAWPSYHGLWDSRVTEFLVDGKDTSDGIDTDHLRLLCPEGNWNEIEFSLTITTTEGPSSEVRDQSAHLLVSCPATNLRRAYPMQPVPGGRAYEARVRLPRSVLSEKVSLQAEITASIGDRRRLIASALEWALIVTEGQAPPTRTGAPPLWSAWIDFSDDEAPPEARRNAGAYCYVDLNADPPIFYLNSAIDGFQSLINADTARNERRRHRDLLGSLVARNVLQALFRAMVEEVEAGDHGTPAAGPDLGLLRNVAEAVAAELPDTDTAEDLYEKIADVTSSAGATAGFLAEVDLVIDRLSGLSTTISRVCEEAKNV